MTSDAAKEAAEALAETFTSATGYRNPDWDPEGPQDDTNPYHLPRTMEERIQDGTWITFPDTDGHSSMRPATLLEIAQVLADAGLLTNPSQNEVFEIYDKLTRKRLNEVIYETPDQAFLALEEATTRPVDEKHFRIQGVRFERRKR